MKVFKKIVVATIITFSFNSLSVANDVGIEEISINSDHINSVQLQSDIVKIKEKISLLDDPAEIAIQSDEILDKLYDITLSKGKVLHFTNSDHALKKSKQLNNRPSSLSLLSSSNNGAKPGDYIVLKFKKEYAEDWGWIVGNWEHSLLFGKNNELFQAVPGKTARKITFNEFKNLYPYYKIEKAFLVQFNFDQEMQNHMANLSDSLFIGKPYPRIRDLPWTKYDIDTYYCSSIIWRAHIHHMNNYRDLDAVPDHIVFPYELLVDDEVGTLNVITW